MNISQESPEYLNKQLLLANNEKAGLFAYNGNSNIIVEFNGGDAYSIYNYHENKYSKIDISLNDVRGMLPNLNGKAEDTIFKYLITPEMEVERIFNSLRYKYLQAIYLSKFDNPDAYINSSCNKPFQSLSGLNVYQGNTKSRKSKDSFWIESGFSPKAKELGWEKERGELDNILRFIRKYSSEKASEIYAELIAIKPGFHEIYIHDDYFDKESYPKSKSVRDDVFLMLRNEKDVSSINLSKVPPYEINKRNYFSYASCNVTEGPFVAKKGVNVSYYDEIRKISSKDKLRELEASFHILDYCHDNKITSREKLAYFLKEAEDYCRYFT